MKRAGEFLLMAGIVFVTADYFTDAKLAALDVLFLDLGAIILWSRRLWAGRMAFPSYDGWEPSHPR